MPTADPAELVAELVCDPRHICTELCLCEKLKEIPEIAEYIERLEYQIRCASKTKVTLDSSV